METNGCDSFLEAMTNSQFPIHISHFSLNKRRFQPLHQAEHGAVVGRGNVQARAGFDDRSAHHVDLSLPPGFDILEHRAFGVGREFLEQAGYGLPPLVEIEAEDSERLLNESIDQNPDLPYSYAQLGYTKYNRGDFKGALEEYNKALRIDPNEVEYLLNRGLAKHKLNDYAGAIADFTKAISLKADFEKAWFNRGNVLTKLNRCEEAIEDYSLAIFYDPGYAAAYYNRALGKNKLGMNKEACEDLRMAASLEMEVFVHPNPKEPFGIAPLEAMASGVATVAPNAGGILSYATNENAWLVEPTGEKFAEAIREVVENSSLRESKIAKALETARANTREASTDRLFATYDKIHEDFQNRKDLFTDIAKAKEFDFVERLLT